ncbi:MAG: hypothetical protein NTU79_05150 [Planctomycetota bacterium]|nr:hypothetical protein [Planctomycetota bacterium]
MTLQVWTGHVNAIDETPVSTELNFKAGSKVTIVSSGFAAYKAAYWFGPSGQFQKQSPDLVAPNELTGALLVKCGHTYTSVVGGLLNWSPPTDDNLEFVYNDAPGGYFNNDGGFDLQMQYDTDDLQS